MRKFRLEQIFYCLTLLVFLPSCATIVSDGESTTYIATEPEGARCELHGQDFKRVVTTPDSITLPSEASPITVACKADGYRTTSAKLDTSNNGWMAGNIIFGLIGGPIGLMIDAASGAGMEFPARITVILDPESFKTMAERDDWYDKRRNIVEANWKEIIKNTKYQCQTNNTETCDGKIKRAQEQSAKEIGEIEQRRAAAVIGEPAPIQNMTKADTSSSTSASVVATETVTDTNTDQTAAANTRVGAELENYIAKRPKEFKSKLSAFARKHDLGETEIGWHPKVTDVVSYEVQEKTGKGYVVAIKFYMATSVFSGTLNRRFLIEFNNNRLRFVGIAPNRSRASYSRNTTKISQSSRSSGGANSTLAPPVVSRAEAETYFRAQNRKFIELLTVYNRENSLAYDKDLLNWDVRATDIDRIEKLKIEKIDGNEIYVKTTFRAGTNKFMTATYLLVVDWRNGNPIIVDHLKRS